MLPLTKRQREILDYLNEFIQQHGYAPSLEEIGRRFGLSSLATVHKHLTNLQEKGFIKRAWNRSRSVELVPTRAGRPRRRAAAAGLRRRRRRRSRRSPRRETIAVPEDLVGKRDTYVLRVRGESMIDEQIRDGDFVIVEDRKTAENGEMVIALLGEQRRHAEEVLPRERPRPPAAGQPDDAAAHRPRRPGAGAGRRRRRHAEVLTSGRARRPCVIVGTPWPNPSRSTSPSSRQTRDDHPRTYANFCAIAHTPFDFTLTFCEVLPLTEKDLKEAEAEPRRPRAGAREHRACRCRWSRT